MFKECRKAHIKWASPPLLDKKNNVSQSTDGIYSNYRQQMGARVWCFFSEPIGSPLKNRNCVCKSTEIQGEWHGIRDGCVIHRQPESNRKVFWSLNEKYLQQSIIIASQERALFFPPFLPFFRDLNTSAENQSQSDGGADYSLLIALIMNNMFLDVPQERRVPRREKEFSAGACLPERSRFQADHLCLSSSLRRGERETELLGHSNEHARKWASAQKWHRLRFAYAEWG